MTPCSKMAEGVRVEASIAELIQMNYQGNIVMELRATVASSDKTLKFRLSAYIL